MWKISAGLLTLLLPWLSWAQVAVGKKAASEYFVADSKLFTNSRFVGAHMGQFFGSRRNGEELDGEAREFGLAISMGRWLEVVEIPLRVSIRYAEPQALKTYVVMTGIVYPGHQQSFPLYVGLFAGVGQSHADVDLEESMSTEFRGVIGWRWHHVLGGVGAFTEVGWNSQQFLVSGDQVTANALSAGLVYRF